MSRYPFTSYPDGWFRVAYSHELPVGGVQPIEALGKDLVAFRGEDGRVRVLDAHCPHLGAHLGVGGTVVGNVIACPFHDWRFDGEGTCVDIPYSDRVPKKARVGAWDVQEQNGIVFVWHHHAGAPPAYTIPTVRGFGDRRWSKRLHFHWRARVHVQEVAENALDLAHFQKVHNYLSRPDLEAFTTEAHSFFVSLRGGRRVMGVNGEADMRITYHGLGVVHAEVDAPADTRLSTVLTTTPVDEEHCDIHIAVQYKKHRIPLWDRFLTKFLVDGIQEDFTYDIPIWENKEYYTRPLLVNGDGPIMKVRKWAQQFYAPDADASLRAGA